MMNFPEIILILLLENKFYMAKSIRAFSENLTDYFLNIIVNANWFEIWILLRTSMKYCYKYALNKKLKLMGGAMKYFLKTLLGQKIFRLPYASNFHLILVFVFLI